MPGYEPTDDTVDGAVHPPASSETEMKKWTPTAQKGQGLIDRFSDHDDEEYQLHFLLMWYLCLYCDHEDAVAGHQNRIYVTKNCPECQGTDRDTIPWSELFKEGRSR